MVISKIYAYISVIMLMMVLGVGIQANADDSPSISVSPSPTVTKGEVVTVYGYGFPINSSIRVDLLLPSGGSVEGITSANVNSLGTFIANFTCPDQNGDGYVKVICGTIVLSTLLHFEGTQYQTKTLTVTLNPPSPYDGDLIHITALGDFLKGNNYVVDFKTTNPEGMDEINYFVFHEGKAEFDYTFEMSGFYFLNLSIEKTNYYYSQYLEVLKKDTENPPVQGSNITWEISNEGNVYTAMLWKENYGYIQTGNITVKSPNGKTQNVLIKNNEATIITNGLGTYILKYISGGRQYSTTFDYDVTMMISSTPFDENGDTTLTVYVNSNLASGDIQCNISGAEDDTMTISNGIGQYTALSVGNYIFSINYMGVTKSTTENYNDIYTPEELSTTIVGNQVIVTGIVLGQKTQSAGANKQVQVSVPSQGNFKQTTTSMSDGSFEMYFDIADKGGIGGLDVQIKVTVTNSGISSTSTTKTTSVHVSHDILGEYGLVFIGLGALIFFVGYFKGWWFKVSGGRFLRPPKGRGGGEDAPDDDETY